MLQHDRAAARELSRDRAHPARPRAGAAARLAAACSPTSRARSRRSARAAAARSRTGRSRARSSTATRRRAHARRPRRLPPIWRTPVRGTYRGLELVSMPPPSSGGVLLVEMLNALEPYDVAVAGPELEREVNLVAGAMKLAFADRAEYLGDPGLLGRCRPSISSRRRTATELAALLRKPPFFLLRAPWNWGKPVIPERAARGARAADRRRHDTDLGRRRAGQRGVAHADGEHAVRLAHHGAGHGHRAEQRDGRLLARPTLPNAWGAVGSGANAIQPGQAPALEHGADDRARERAGALRRRQPDGHVHHHRRAADRCSTASTSSSGRSRRCRCRASTTSGAPTR